MLLWNEGGAAEHAILLDNSQQPNSDQRSFPKTSRLMFCKAVVADAIRQVTANERIVGFMFCGDANCNLPHWLTALMEDRTWEMHFDHPRYLYANNGAVAHYDKQKSGDITVVFSVKGQQFEGVQEDCRVRNRERQHDVSIVGWTYTPILEKRAHPLPGRLKGRAATAQASAPANRAKSGAARSRHVICEDVDEDEDMTDEDEDADMIRKKQKQRSTREV